MQTLVDIITLGVTDFTASRDFYVEGLGWEPVFEIPSDIAFFQVGHGLLLSLFSAAALDADAEDVHNRSSGSPPMSLARVVETEDEVIATLQRARRAGATVLKEPQKAEFGGFHCYFADPSGFRWEIATNPGMSVAPDGTVTIGTVEG